MRTSPSLNFTSYKIDKNSKNNSLALDIKFAFHKLTKNLKSNRLFEA